MPSSKSDTMRGLAVFISDIRNCKSREAEIKRINKELANIRSKFKGDKQLDGYSKKKYVCKLLFIFLLGVDIDFGYMEAVNLLSSIKYTEKQIGYLFISVLIDHSHDLMKLVIQSIKNDLNSGKPIHISLALNCVANVGSPEMAEQLASEVPRILVGSDTMDTVRQNAALCLLRLYRVSTKILPPGEWTTRIVQLLSDKHLGVVTAACSLIYELARENPEDYKACVPLAVSRLSRIATANYGDLQDYTYYFVPAPWLSVKLLRLLQTYPPPDDPAIRARLHECIEAVLNRAMEPPKSKKVQHSNAKNAVIFEAISLIIHYDNDPDQMVRACNQLGTFLSSRETNLRYLALESMCALASSEYSHDAVKKHQSTVIQALKSERDVSVRQRAIDLLYAMCDKTNAIEIVEEMLNYLKTADYSIREEMVLKVAILAERYAVDYTWYVDTILRLIGIAGDYVSEEVWYRVIQITVNRDDVQGYAAKTVFEALQAPACHENMVKVGAYILGEFGNLIAGDGRSSAGTQFELLHSKFHFCSTATRAILLTTYVKFINLFPELKGQIQKVLRSDNQIRNADVELQQRCLEYLRMTNVASSEVLNTVLEVMPPFPERDSSILAKLQKKKSVISNKNLADGKVENSEGVILLNLTLIIALYLVLPDLIARDPVEPAPTSTIDGASSGALLVDVFAEAEPKLPQSSSEVIAQDNSDKFLMKNNGVLYESSVVQIGVKSEFKQGTGVLSIFFGNKTNFQLAAFTSVVECSADLQTECPPINSILEAGAQVQQTISLEAIGDFMETPLLNLSFNMNGGHQRLSLNLPVFLTKFMSPVEMNAENFFMRWKNLSGPAQEAQEVFKAKFPMDKEQSSIKIQGFGFSVLEGIDPNIENFISAGILYTRQGQVGCLMRLEPNLQASMYRLTIRASRDNVSGVLFKLINPHF
ncbi:uncharacterized protein TRIADDRAFT_19420 [Trichoplax adhaerens]|uniref:AP-2 complex subunit alpha n=1 Tax=Trichoplax adhaerens TaxID=10228 RepID=B3RL03_TRIAD|nr:hypothetical protein TRIADDRAFT_19420 [Trichoplax adhaerens]EDV28677.1 hypothetical protein TRIADDRAFT_19420 [Trichoplax adhaerens]|eukprot:XP_002107879.1 hypothetical protein TRIADDRAFT_19420 [Trichoplax adhaerens]